MFKSDRQTGYQMRDAARYSTNGVSCNHGEVLDLSGTGMRFRVEGRCGLSKGDVHRFVLESGGQRLNLTGNVAWTKRIGLLGREHEVGVRFSNLKPAHSRAIEDFAVKGFVERRDGESSPKPKSAVRVEVPDLYAIMGVTRDASQDDIHGSYRKLAKELHPDVTDEPDAAEQFTVVSKAYRVLQDPESRARYDRMLDEAA